MLKLKTFDLQGNMFEDTLIDDVPLRSCVHSQLVKNYIGALRKNARQWSANTRGRGELAQSNAKPRPQKGSGRARQGSIKSPQYRGGGVVFGPKPKFNCHSSGNKKERRAAIQYLLTQKLLNDNVRVLKSDMSITTPKTKLVGNFLKNVGLENKRVLFLNDTANEDKGRRDMFYLSMRNIPKTQYLSVMNFSGYDVVVNQEIVLLDCAVAHFTRVLRKRK